MKQIKKFLGVFLALAMVVGMVGMMPVVEAKAATTTTNVTVVKPIVGDNKTIVSVVFNDGIYDGTTVANTNISKVVLVSGANETELTVSGVNCSGSTSSITVNPHNVTAGDLIKVTLVNAAPSNKVFATNGDDYGAGPYTSEPATAGVSVNTSFPNRKPVVGFNADNLSLTVTDIEATGKAEFVFVGIPAPAKGDKPEAVKAYDVFQMTDGTIDIDLSVYGVKKDVKLWLHFGNGKLEWNADTMIEVSISQNLKTFKPVYDYKTEKFAFDVKEGKAVSKIEYIGTNPELYDPALAILEYRVGASADWTVCTEENLKNAVNFSSMYGTTIYFREIAVEGIGEVPNKFPSAEAKVKIAKQANAPKITVDYVKGTVSFAKGVQVYGLVGAPDWTGLAAWAGAQNPEVKTAAKTPVAVDDTKAAVINISDLGGGETALTFFVRTNVSVNKNTGLGTKPISKIAVVEIGEQGNAPIFNSTNVDGNDITVEKAKKNKKSATTGAEIKNVTEQVMQYKLGDDAWKALAADKKVTITFEKLKDVTLLFRFAGVKNKSLPSIELPLVGNDIATFVTPDVTATVVDVTIDGTVGTELTSSKEVKIVLADDAFKAIRANADLAAWITNLPAGLTATAKAAVVAEAAEVTIEIKGTPTDASDAELIITIPKEVLYEGKDVTVTTNVGAKFAITPATPEEE